MEPFTGTIDEFLQHALQGDESGETLVVPGWRQDEWSTLLSGAQPVDLDTGEVLIHQGADDCELYFVVSGRLEVATIDSTGAAIVSLATVSAGSVVGEFAFFDGAPRSAKVWAVRPTQLLKLSRGDYERYASENAREAHAFVMAMARLLAYRLRNRPPIP